MQATNNKQANNQAKEAHQKKLCTKYSHSYWKRPANPECKNSFRECKICQRAEGEKKLPLGKCKSDRGCRKLQGATVVVLIGRELELVWELNWFFQRVTCYTQPGAVTKVSEV